MPVLRIVKLFTLVSVMGPRYVCSPTTVVFGAMVDTFLLVLNGSIGAGLHVPFPVAIRSSLGFYFSCFADVTRMITMLFWHDSYFYGTLPLRC